MQTFTKHEVLAYAAELLREWGDGEMPPKPDWGICGNLELLVGNTGHGMTYALSRFWHACSYNNFYPVKGYGGKSPSVEFFRLKKKWGHDKYGDDRRDLCHFLADEIEEYLETGEC